MRRLEQSKLSVLAKFFTWLFACSSVLNGYAIGSADSLSSTKFTKKHEVGDVWRVFGCSSLASSDYDDAACCHLADGVSSIGNADGYTYDEIRKHAQLSGVDSGVHACCNNDNYCWSNGIRGASLTSFVSVAVNSASNCDYDFERLSQALGNTRGNHYYAYDSATGVWDYVVQNPWIKFDPLGLRVESKTKKNEDGSKTTSISFTGKIIDESGTLSKKQLDFAKSEITGALKKVYNGKEGDHNWVIDVKIEVVDSAKKIKSDDHVFHLREPNARSKKMGKVGQARFGSLDIDLDKNMITDQSMRHAEVAARALANGNTTKWFAGDTQLGHTAVHESGHTFGLFHPSNPASFNTEASKVDGEWVFRGFSWQNPIKNLSENNFIRYPHPLKHMLDGDNPLFKSDASQIRAMTKYYDARMLNKRGGHSYKRFEKIPK